MDDGVIYSDLPCWGGESYEIISSIYIDFSFPRFFKPSPQVLRMALDLYMVVVSLLVLVSAEYLLLLPLLSRSVPPRRFGGVSRVFSRSWYVIDAMISEIGSLNDLLTRLRLELWFHILSTVRSFSAMLYFLLSTEFFHRWHWYSYYRERIDLENPLRTPTCPSRCNGSWYSDDQGECSVLINWCY